MGKKLLAMAPGVMVKHYKGGVYKILHIALGCSLEIERKLMIVYENANHQVFVRTVADFTADVNGVDRFEEIR
jgi:hypothetical protein